MFFCKHTTVFSNKPNNCNEQRVLFEASTCHRSYYPVELQTTLLHTESNTRTTFILFYSCLAD